LLRVIDDRIRGEPSLDLYNAVPIETRVEPNFVQNPTQPEYPVRVLDLYKSIFRRLRILSQSNTLTGRNIELVAGFGKVVKLATFFYGTEGCRQFFERLVRDTKLAGGWLPNTDGATVINLIVKLYSDAQEKAMRASSILVILYVVLKVS
jgi:hypothetical protein